MAPLLLKELRVQTLIGYRMRVMFEGGLGPVELVIILAIAVIVFGPKSLIR